MNCIKRIGIVVILFFCFFTNAYADELDDTYAVVDYSDEALPILFSSNDYFEAYNFYINNVYSYKNLCLFEDKDAVFMEYGTIYIKENGDVVTYYSLIDEIEKELTNYNEYDLLYISESYDSVQFAIGGDIGLIYKDEVTYYPYNSHTVSYYDCQNESLVHHIASSTNNYYKYNLQIDIFPEFLDSSKKYYSNDGHYFYDDFYKYSDDYYLGSFEASVNYKDPYFNYYAYLPSRSYTNYSYGELNGFITNSLGIKGRINAYNDFDNDGANDVINRSEYFDNIKSFISSESVYGVNALTSLAWSSEESAYGKSKNSYINNNVFNHEALTGSEIENKKYSSVKSSIYSHADNYVSRKYCNVFSPLYVGSHIGDFMSGIASVYSNDPLFSDKVVAKVYFYDSSLGCKDKNYYSIGITNKAITLFYDKDLSTMFDIVRDVRNYSLIILEEYDDVYKVQCDYSMNQIGEYNPEKSVAYVKKSAIDRVIDGKAESIEYKSYTVDTSEDQDNKALIYLYNTKEIDIRNEFVYKDKEGYGIKSYALEDNIYQTHYKKIKEIIAKDFDYPSVNNNGVVINNGKVIVLYEDGTTETKNGCGDYILSSSHSNKQTTINLTFNNVKTNISITGDYDINGGNDLESFAVFNNYAYSDYSFEDVENFDRTYDIGSNTDISTYVRENEYDLNVAGAYPSFIYHSSDKLANIINTYYFDIKSEAADNSIHSIVSKYGLEYCDGFDVSISRCFYKISLVSPIIMQVKVPHANDNTVYTVYHKNSNGDIIKLPTQFSDSYIKFLAIDDGKYYIYSTPTASVYSIDDRRFIVNADSNGVDYYSVAEEGIQLFVLSASGYLLYAIYAICKRRENKAWKDYRRLLQQAESVQEETQSN